MTIDYPFLGTANTATVRKTLIQSLTLLALLAFSQAARAQTVLPADANNTCIVAPDDFKKWFVGNAVAKDGIVGPANSLTFTAPFAALCPFFTWSEQMFLWLTSPVGSGHVFDTPEFYEVLPPDPLNGGTRTLRTPATPGKFLSFAPSIPLLGSQGQEVAFDSTGKIHDVVRPQTGPAGQIALLNTANQLAEVGRVLAAPDGKPVLLDKTGNAIDVKKAPDGSPLLRNESGPLRDKSGAIIDLAPSTVLVNGKPSLLTTSGAVVGTEQGQADSYVLMAQNGSLVYYLLQVNDVFAYFRTGAVDAKINPAPTQFPTAQAALDAITTVAQQAPAPNTKQQFPDGIALTMEIKSSWVETTGLANVGDYITINATIPTYTQSPDNKTWTPSGTKQATLALIGMHVVGSANGHPEMIWATFEHVNNSPNQQYTYKKAPDAPATKPADGAGSWLLSAAGAAPAPSPSRMLIGSQNNIIAADGQTIGPVNVTRIDPWGSDPTAQDTADKNTAVISINRSVIDQLAAGDVRKNYILVGSIWTDGNPPVVPSSNPPVVGNLFGTTFISNSTMETFEQPGTCMKCHTSRGVSGMLGNSNGGGLSHIWGKINPLFAATAAPSK